MADKKEKSFEEKEKRLGEIIGELEGGKELTLKQTSELYAEGKKLLEEMNAELKTLKDLVTNEIVADK
jgi:exonuclease VII small subunit